MRLITSGTCSSGCFSRTRTFTITCGKTFRSATSCCSALPERCTMSRTSSAVSRPSPVVLCEGKRICPDCSPPRVALCWRIICNTYLSPTGARSMRIFVVPSAASRPIFDIVVATTVLSLSSPRAWRSRAASSSTASPLTTFPFASAKSALSASSTRVRQVQRAAKCREEFGGDGRRSAVGAIENNTFAAEIESRHYLAEEDLVVMAVARLHGNRGGCLRYEWNIRQTPEDFILNLQLLLVGQLVTIAAEDLDAVVLPGIV